VSYSGGTQLDAVSAHFYLRHKVGKISAQSRLIFLASTANIFAKKMTKSSDVGVLIIGVFHVSGISLKYIAVLKEFDLRKRLFGLFTGTRKINEVSESSSLFWDFM
jgi:hypothetical protein